MEQATVNEYLSVLEKDFYIHREVPGKSKISGAFKRVDAVIISKTHSNFKFGIEFKRVDLKSYNDFTSWFKQALIYTQCEWGTVGKLPIVIAPCMNYQDNKEAKFLFERMLGEFGIGEIDKFYNKNESRWVYNIKISGNRVYSVAAGDAGTYNQVYLKTDFTKRLEL